LVGYGAIAARYETVVVTWLAIGKIATLLFST
jgi:hypothetical protein